MRGISPLRHLPYTVRQVRLSKPPREWANPDHEFGHNANVRWHQAVTDAEKVELAAAQIQHHALIRARILMVPRNYTFDRLAAATGIDSSVIGKLFRGDRPLHLTHIAAFERTLGNIRGGGP